MYVGESFKKIVGYELYLVGIANANNLYFL